MGYYPFFICVFRDSKTEIRYTFIVNKIDIFIENK